MPFIPTDRINELMKPILEKKICKDLHLYYSRIFPGREPETGEEQVQQMVNQAVRFGITRVYDLQRLGELLLQEKLPLDQAPETGWIAEILDMPFPNGAARALHIRRSAVIRDIEKMCGPGGETP